MNTLNAGRASRSGLPHRSADNMTAVECMLAGLIDYAGLYPPAGANMRTAARNYLDYRHGNDREALGRFVIDLARLEELHAEAGDSQREFRLSVIAAGGADWARVAALREEGWRIEAIECKAASVAEIEDAMPDVPADIEVFLEVPVAKLTAEHVSAARRAGARIKLRTGGVTPEAFPSTRQIARAITLLAHDGVGFKATAGLHHPLRSENRLTYANDSAVGTMHGFVNLTCAAALLFAGGDEDEAVQVLEARDVNAWRVTAESIAWRARAWTSETLRTTRERFFLSFGSCSFTEPLADLEALGWR